MGCSCSRSKAETLAGVVAGREVAADVEERRAVVRVEGDDAGDAEQGGEEAVAHLEHVGVAAEQRGGDDADDEARGGRRRRRRRPCAGGRTARRSSPPRSEPATMRAWASVLHVAADHEVGPDRERGTEDQAGQVLADRRDARLPARRPRAPAARLGRPRPVASPRCPPVAPAPCAQATAAISRFSPRSIGSVTFAVHVLEFLLIAGARGRCWSWPRPSSSARSYVRRHWRLLRGHVATRGVLATLALLAAGRERYAARATPEELSRGAAARVRRRMWVAVEDAEHRGRPRRHPRRPGGRPARRLPLAAAPWPASWTGCCAWSAGCRGAPTGPTRCAARWPR